MTAQFGKRYLLGDKLGQGGMGAVYRAVDRLTGETVALKSVTVPTGLLQFNSRTRAEGGSSSELRYALAQEFRMLASMRHPHVVSVLDYGFDESGLRPFFTMELLENAGTLVKAGRDQPLEIRLSFIMQLLQALAYLHRRGILHRDLKPGNVLVVGNQVKVVDFGLAMAPGQSKEVTGTLAYIAPEVLQGQYAHVQSDLYAVGVMLYELLAGSHPFRIGRTDTLIHDVLNTVPNVSGLDARFAPVVGKLLMKSPAARYATAESIIAALSEASGLPAPAESSAIRESFLQAAAFVGREAEMSVLSGALDDVGQGRPSVWLVGGESGVGKSRLLSELRTLALVKGAAVLRGGARAEYSAPYDLWREPLCWLALLADAEPREVSILAAFVPEVERLSEQPLPKLTTMDARLSQSRLFRTVGDLLLRVPGVLMIVLEDLHWADAESLALLRWLNEWSAKQARPLLIVGSYRDDEARDLPERLPGMQILKLNRLSDAAIARLSELMLGMAGRSEVVTFLQQETEGNVFFLVEVVRALAEEAGQLERVSSLTLPAYVVTGGVEQVIRRRLAHVPASHQPLLCAAAVLGRQLDLAVMRAIPSHLPLDDWLTDCANAAVLETEDGRWRFAHDKLRTRILADLPADELRTLHRHAAQAIETAHGDTPGQAVPLARHWRAAGDMPKEAHYAHMAGVELMRTGAYAEAQAHFERALTLEVETESDLKARAALRSSLGRVLYDRGDYPGARHVLTEASTLAANAGDEVGMAQSLGLLGNIALALGDYQTAHDALSQALIHARTANDTREMGQAHRSLGVVTETLGRMDDAQTHFESALTLLQQAGDEMGEAGTLLNLGTIARGKGDYLQARRLLEAGLARFEAIGFPWGTAFALTTLGLILEALNEPTEAKRLHLRGVEICRSIGHRWGQSYILSNLADACYALRDYDSAGAHLEEALRIAMEIQTAPLALQVLTGIARLKIEQGDFPGAAAALAFVLDHPLTEAEVRKRAQSLRIELELEWAFMGSSPELVPAVPQTLEALARTLLPEYD